MHAIRDELERTLVGGRIQQLIPLGPHELGLEIYAQRQRRSLLFSIEPVRARIHLIRGPLQRATDEVTPFLLLLRKYVRGGWLEAVEQPHLERLLRLRITKRLEEDRLSRVELVLEAMGRRSNLVLVDEDGTILDAMKRLPPSRNPARPLLPHLRYTPPPAQERLDPAGAATVAALRDEAIAPRGGAAVRLAELLSARLAGCSPQLGRELAFRAAGNVGALAGPATDWSAVRRAIEEVYRPLRDGSWTPTLAWRGERAVAFAPYRLTHLADAELRAAASMSEAIETYVACGAFEAGLSDRAAQAADDLAGIAQNGRSPLPVHQAGAGTPNRLLLAALARRREQLARKRAALERSLDEARGMDELREAGEAILASAASIAPGQEALSWGERTIRLDPTLDPVANAQRYFREYRKARDAVRQVPELLREVERDLAYLDELAVFVASAAEPGQLRALRAELAEVGVTDGRPRGDRSQRPRSKERGKAPSAYRRVATEQGCDILVGTSARGNEVVTFELARPDDLWLHARGVPGAHVVVRAPAKGVPRQVLERAARLAAAHSAAAGSGKVGVDWTERRYVRRQPGGRPGQVTYTRAQTLVVEAEG